MATVYDKTVVDSFLKNQLQLFPEKVADSPEEAEEFLEDCAAVVCKDKKSMVEYMRDNLDAAELNDDELLEAEEVFPLPDGRFLIVEA